MALKEDLLQLLKTDTDFREAARRELLTDELLSAPDRLDRVAGQLEALTVQVTALTSRLDRMADLIENLNGEMQSHAAWRRGEDGRRAGERYERDTVRRAYLLFGGGRDATERPEDLDRLRSALDGPAAAREVLPEVDDPSLSDLLWLKGERVLVVEVSKQVDRWDIERAARRAATLRRGGMTAVPVVIGQGWASDEAASEAADQDVEWRIGEEASPGYLALRRQPAS
jgi:hypothetical protein